MKKFLLVFLLIITNHSLLIAQSGWVRVSDSIPNLVIMSMQFTSVNTGYAVGSYNTNYPGAFLRTTNAGLNWQFYNFPNHSADDVCFLNDNTGYISAWSGPPYGSYTLKTTNGGINWICIDTVNASFFNMKFYDLNTGIVAAKYSTVLKTTDGGYNWIFKTGVQWMEPACIWCFDADNWLVTDDSYYINKTTNGGESWILLDFTNIDFLSHSLFFVNSSTGYSSTRTGKIFKSTNTGNNWAQVASINSFYGFISNIFFVNENTGFLCGYGTYGNIYKTTDGGYNWISKSTNPIINMSHIFFINSNTGFAGGYNGLIYKTTTGGNVFVNNISTEIPINYSLNQNYPNPFNAMTKIKFDIQKSVASSQYPVVSLKVFDLLGREAAVLVNEQLQPESYEVTFDGSSLPSGVYFYSLETNQFKDTKRMVMIK